MYKIEEMDKLEILEWLDDYAERAQEESDEYKARRQTEESEAVRKHLLAYQNYTAGKASAFRTAYNLVKEYLKD